MSFLGDLLYLTGFQEIPVGFSSLCRPLFGHSNGFNVFPLSFIESSCRHQHRLLVFFFTRLQWAFLDDQECQWVLPGLQLFRRRPVETFSYWVFLYYTESKRVLNGADELS